MVVCALVSSYLKGRKKNVESKQSNGNSDSQSQQGKETNSEETNSRNIRSSNRANEIELQDLTDGTTRQTSKQCIKTGEATWIEKTKRANIYVGSVVAMLSLLGLVIVIACYLVLIPINQSISNAPNRIVSIYHSAGFVIGSFIVFKLLKYFYNKKSVGLNDINDNINKVVELCQHISGTKATKSKQSNGSSDSQSQQETSASNEQQDSTKSVPGIPDLHKTMTELAEVCRQIRGTKPPIQQQSRGTQTSMDLDSNPIEGELSNSNTQQHMHGPGVNMSNQQQPREDSVPGTRDIYDTMRKLVELCRQLKCTASTTQTESRETVDCDSQTGEETITSNAHTHQKEAATNTPAAHCMHGLTRSATVTDSSAQMYEGTTDPNQIIPHQQPQGDSTANQEASTLHDSLYPYRAMMNTTKV